jgi:hypothetical protein
MVDRAYHPLQAPDAAKTIAMQQLETLTACANGLTPSDEDMFDLEPEETASTSRALETCRQDERLVKLREGILQTVSKVIEIWGADVEVASVSPDSLARTGWIQTNQG